MKTKSYLTDGNIAVGVLQVRYPLDHLLVRAGRNDKGKRGGGGGGGSGIYTLDFLKYNLLQG